ncbi:hypothetical protein [Pantoea sp.]|uniref:HAD family hydrolase n=1 Tax=Pantoea sp. TaxID=69393 RepID=UPI0028B1841E|nr:hypothetical protein [Pantoea sp.]
MNDEDILKTMNFKDDEMELASLRHQAKQARVISFDFFDTLFVRPLNDPEDAFDLVGCKFGLDNFRQLRRKAQALAFKQMVKEGRKEITLENIYNQFPDVRSDVGALARAEYDIELALVEPNPFFLKFFYEMQAAGKTVVITSDMYMGEDFFRAALDKYNIPQVPLYISATRNATKRDTGEIFDFIIQDCEVSADDILHIGDNELADVVRPREKGLKVWHYQPEHLRTKHQRSKLKGQSLGTSLIEGLYRTSAPEEVPNHTFQQLGYVYQGSATLGFLEWIRKQCIKDEVDNLLFVSRDGFSLERLARNYFSDRLPDFSYFMGSRIAFNLALMTEDNFGQHINFLMSGSDGLSPGELLERIGIEPPTDDVMYSLGVPPQMIIKPENYALVQKFLLGYKAEILKVCQRNRRGLFIYLNNLGIKPGDTVALVDVGWSGTTQEAFEQTVKSFFNINVVGYYFCLANTIERRRRDSHMNMKALINAESFPQAVIDKVYENRVAVELFFSAPHNTVIGYKPVGKRVIPVTDVGRSKAKDHNVINDKLNIGVDAFCNDYHNLIGKLQVSLTPLQLSSPLVELVTKDSWRQNQLFQQVENFDSWGSSRNQTVKFADYFKKS